MRSQPVGETEKKREKEREGKGERERRWGDKWYRKRLGASNDFRK